MQRLATNLRLAQEAEPEGGDLFHALRDGAIQSFEFTFDTAIKTVKRLVEDRANPPNIDSLPFRDLLRIAAEIGLVDEIEPWIAFRAHRNETSHTYNEEKARKVYDSLPEVVAAVTALISRTEALVDASHAG